MVFSERRNGGTLNDVKRCQQTGISPCCAWGSRPVLGREDRAMRPSTLRRLRAAPISTGFTAIAAIALFAVPAAMAGPASTRAADSAAGHAALTSAEQAGAG